MILRLSPVVDLGADHGEQLLACPQRSRLKGRKKKKEETRQVKMREVVLVRIKCAVERLRRGDE